MDAIAKVYMRNARSLAHFIPKNNFYTYSNEPSQPLDRVPKICISASEALQVVKSSKKHKKTLKTKIFIFK